MKLTISDIQGFTPKVEGDYELICSEENKEIHRMLRLLAENSGRVCNTRKT